MDRTVNYVKLDSLQVRLPTFQNHIIEDIFSLILCEMLIGSKWRELIKIIVEFDPPGAKLTNRLITKVKKHVVAHINFLFKQRIVSREHMFHNGSETLNMSIFCLFFLFCCLVVKDTKSLAFEQRTCDVEARWTVVVESIALDNDVEFLHEFEPLLSHTVRGGFDVHLYESLSLSSGLCLTS
jgi:hypothetical protein